MKKLSSAEIRESFVGFFQKNDHLKISSSSIIPKNDNTLLYINSGMAPLKKYFLGYENPPSQKLCNVQPCIRTKDIDDVGDRHHLTIFEMLGSWSIGDYYKQKAIELAYDLLINHLGFDSNRLYATVYSGNKTLGLAPDEISHQAWSSVGFSSDHIISLGDDNFWGPAGDTGPCGPCTEVFYDTGDAYGDKYVPGKIFDTTNRYIEIWNAGVFMEFNKNVDGSFSKLPLKSVDTGAGLERLSMIMNGFDTVYDIDLMAPILKTVSSMYKISEAKTRMISDHLRAASFILAEGIVIGNEGQGYIPRRLIRKSISALVGSKYKSLDFDPILDVIIGSLKDFYPIIGKNEKLIKSGIMKETKDFIPVISKGLEKVDEILDKSKTNSISGQQMSDLVTTFGLPFDVLEVELLDRNVKFKKDDFDKSYNEHRKISRVIKRSNVESSDEKLESLIVDLKDSVFSGYDQLSDKSNVVSLISKQSLVEELNVGDSGFIITKVTPFYGESGGQVGDQGEISWNSGKAQVIDTLKIKGIHIHVVKLLKGKIKNGSEVNLSVDQDIRKMIQANHSATHLLHKALHEIVGDHALQKGSMVSHERLRFDFTNNVQVTDQQLREIESYVNDKISLNVINRTEVMNYDDAVKQGAMALFGENYKEKVRVVNFKKQSMELCGGTHVAATGEIGTFIITSETSVAKGIRRIEAVTGINAIKLIQKRNEILKKSSDLFKVNNDNLYERLVEFQKKYKEQKKNAQSVSASSVDFLIKESIQIKDSLKMLIAQVDGDTKIVKDIGDRQIEKEQNDIVCLFSVDKKSTRVFVWVSKAQTEKIKSADILNNILSNIGGKGGGKPHFSQGGGEVVSDISKFIDEIKKGLKNI